MPGCALRLNPPLEASYHSQGAAEWAAAAVEKPSCVALCTYEYKKRNNPFPPFSFFFLSMSLPRLMRNDGAMRRPTIQAARLILLAARDGSWRKEIDAGRSLCFDDSKDGLQQVTF